MKDINNTKSLKNKLLKIFGNHVLVYMIKIWYSDLFFMFFMLFIVCQKLLEQKKKAANKRVINMYSHIITSSRNMIYIVI